MGKVFPIEVHIGMATVEVKYDWYRNGMTIADAIMFLTEITTSMTTPDLTYIWIRYKHRHDNYRRKIFLVRK